VLIASAFGAAAIATLAVVLVTVSRRPLVAGADSVGIIDTAGGALRAVVNVGGQPGGIAVGAGAIWETDTTNDLLLEINPVTRSVERIPVGRNPTAVAVGGGEVWVVNQLDRTVSELNPRALRIVNSFPVGNGAGAVAVGDGWVWVANVTDDTISRIDPQTGAHATIPLSGAPAGIAVGSTGVWVTNNSTGQLLQIDPATDQITQVDPIGNSPDGVALGDGSVWVANASDGTVSRFDPSTGHVAKVNVGASPVGVAYGDGAAWAADSLGGTIARIDPRSNSARLLRVGGAPTALTVAGTHVWTTVLPGLATHLGGTLTAAVGPLYTSVGTSVDPAQWAGLSQWQMLSMTNDGLVTYRRVGGLAGSALVPDLATSLPTPTDGGLTYTFQLRSGIRYSDGALVRPEDFRHELERVFTLGNGYPQLFYTGIVGARRCLTHSDFNGLQPTGHHCDLGMGIVPDDATNTVSFHLTAPDPDFLYKLAFPWADAVPADTPDRPMGRAMPPATGPYMTQSISPGRGSARGDFPLAFGTWILVRNPRFHEWSAAAQPPGYPSRIVLTQSEDPQRAVDAIEAGRLDVLLPVPADRLTELATRYTTQFHSEPLGATFGAVMNTRVPPFDHLAVRQALNYALDRSWTVRLAGGPLAAQPTCQILPPDLSGYEPYCPYTVDPGPSGLWQTPDLAKARRLVDASGTLGMKITFLAEPPNATNPATAIGRYVVSLLDRLGYRASLRITSNLYPTLSDSRSHTQLGWFTWDQDYPGPADFITMLLTCSAFQPATADNLNDAEFCSRKIDAEIRHATALEASDAGAASQTWSAIDRRLTDQAPWLPMYNPRLNIATSSRPGNFQYHPFYGVLLDQLWVR
jgi:ABC-type transport system substrate-binding protein/streptogramin lyase